MEIGRAVYAKAILELVTKPLPTQKDNCVPISQKNESSTFMNSINQNLIGDFSYFVFLEPDDYLSEMISSTFHSNHPNLK